MESDQSTALVHELKTLFNIGVVRDLTDGQLLERFATDRGEAAELAFAVLIERHGPMVLRICRSVLSGDFESDDAFQATFLVLVQKARGLWVRDSLGPWLHEVAFRTASRARLSAARRRKHEERAAATRPEIHTMKTDDFDGLLHSEIERLPELYRAPVVLCDLEGCSHQQAARHLGWPVGTVKSRQARGREKLRDRVRRQGITPSVALLGSGSPFAGTNPVVPAALIEATTRSVVQFVTCQSAVNASILSLAHEVLKAMSMTRWVKTGSVLLVLGVTVSGAGIYAQQRVPAARRNAGAGVTKTGVQEPLTFQATPGKFEVTIVERGWLESARPHDVVCNVQGQTTILQIVPDRTSVKKGEAICELDSAALRDQLTNAQITVAAAEALYQRARRAREAAETAVTEYAEVTFKHELNAVKGEVVVTEAAIQKAERGLDRARRARERLADVFASRKGTIAPSDILAELDLEDRLDAGKQSILREKTELEVAKSRQEILEKHTREKVLAALRLEIEEKQRDELAKKASWVLEQSRAKKLERQIAACKIVAPVDGSVEYANAPRRVSDTRPLQRIEEGAQVRERQKILSVIDRNGPMQVNARVREVHVDKLERGMKAKVRIEFVPGKLFDGTVVAISPLPDPQSGDDGVKIYTTKVKLDNDDPGMRPGMTADIEFLVATRENALTVPVQAVLFYAGKPHIAVRKSGADIELRAVTLGLGNDKLVEITQGIASGDDVILNPTTFLSGGSNSSAAQPAAPSESSRTPPAPKP